MKTRSRGTVDIIVIRLWARIFFHFPSGSQVFHTPKKSGQVLTNTHPPVNSVPRAALPQYLKRPLREAISYFTLVSRLRIYGEYIKFYTCLHFINFTNYIYIHYYLFIIINSFSISSFQISDILYENQASVRFLRNQWHKSRYESQSI